MTSMQYLSPLAVRGPLPCPAGPLADTDVLADRERHYVVDSVQTAVFCSGRGKSIIPPYDGSQDPAARAFFERQVTQAVVALTRHGQEPPSSTTPSLNKLSVRQRCPPTPPPEELVGRQKDYVNDAILAEKMRTKYKDTLLPPYCPVSDRHCTEYFSRPYVQDLMSTTRPEAVEKLPRLSKKHTIGGSQDISSSGGSRSHPARKDPSRHSLPSCPGVAPAHPHSRWQSSRSLEMERQLQLSPLADPRRGLTNKLSYRGRCAPTPSLDTIRYREDSFVNDAIVAEKRRTKYRDIIPPYTAALDRHCWMYFARPDVQRLMSVTKPGQMSESARWQPARS